MDRAGRRTAAGVGDGVIKPWPVTRSEVVADCRIFKVRKNTVTNPRTSRPHEMYVMEQPNWLNVVPLTPDEQVVMIEQWRHGTQSAHLETPGGLIEPGESVEACARRELLEETGYAAEAIIPLGQVHPNPAIQNNLQHYALAKNCRRVREPALDDAEDIVVRLMPLAQIPELILSRHITHSLVIGAFHWLELRRRAGLEV